MPQEFCNVVIKMTKAIAKALFKMYCYTKSAHLAALNTKGRSTASFRETGQDIVICKKCFHFEDYASLMHLFKETEKFDMDKFPVVSIIAEDDETAEEEAAPADNTIPPDWNTWDAKKQQEHFNRVQRAKSKAGPSKQKGTRQQHPQTPRKSQMLREKVNVTTNRSSSKKRSSVEFVKNICET